MRKKSTRRPTRRSVLKLTSPKTVPPPEKLQRMIQRVQLIQAAQKWDNTILERAIKIASPESFEVIQACGAVASNPNNHWIIQIAATCIGCVAIGKGVADIGKVLRVD